MKKIIAAILLTMSMSANAGDFFGAGDTYVEPSDPPVIVDDGVNYCQNVRVVEVEVPVYVEVTEYVEVEVPVYLSDGSRSVWDESSSKLYIYDTEIWNGPEKRYGVIPAAVLEYQGGVDFELIELDVEE